MSKYVIGLDFGTNSCRALLVDTADGRELATHVFEYPSGEFGVIIDTTDPNLARQNPSDYIEGIEVTVKEVIRKAKAAESGFSPGDIIGIGVDTTGSSPMPIDAEGNPLCFDNRFMDNPAAMVWLWKDHTSFAEAELITKTAAEHRPQYLAKIGGVYSSEWFWSKILHCKRESPDVYDAVYSFVEICDWIPAILTGKTQPAQIKRGICAAGHKAMFNEEWDGLPDVEFLESLSPGLGTLRDRLFDKAHPTEDKAGYLSLNGQRN
jgi:L-ribulokinase